MKLLIIFYYRGCPFISLFKVSLYLIQIASVLKQGQKPEKKQILLKST